MSGRVRINVRPGIAVPLVAWFVFVFAFALVGLFVNIARGDSEAVTVTGIVAVLSSLFVGLLWRATHVWLTPEGVTTRTESLGAYFRTELIDWSDVQRFEREKPPGRSPSRRIVATRFSSSVPVVVCQIPAWLLDSSKQLDSAMDRMLRLLEAERLNRSDPSA